MPFKNRWMIEGFLTTISPLHIGSGLPTIRAEFKHGDDFIEISSVATDINGRAYIPGATIKGNLRSWLSSHGADAKKIEQIFGTEDTKRKDAVGGKAEFWNAFAVNVPVFQSQPPFWDPSRLAGLTASVAIDRETRTARERKLYYREFVPTGVTFRLVMTGQDLQENEIILLLHALERGFSADVPMSFGSSASDGWGRLDWELKEIRRLEGKDVLRWIEDGTTSVGYEALLPLSSDLRSALLSEANALALTAIGKRLKLNMALRFLSPFLVNDPLLVTDETPDHLPRRNQHGEIILPASSFRGAFRSQAERIIRTLGGYACDTSNPCDAIEKIEEKKDLCLACQVFGASGWKTLVEVSDFSIIGIEDMFVQEFVAIDRFTGGGADKYKFNSAAVNAPRLAGTLSLDLERIETWGLGLLSLTLRDLMEGDITFGFGAAKGYGECVVDVALDEDTRDHLNQCIEAFFKKFDEKREVDNA